MTTSPLPQSTATSPATSTAKTAARLADLLMPGEVVLHGAHIHWLSYSRPMFILLIALSGALVGLIWPPLAIWILPCLGLALLALLGFAVVALRNWTTQMAITNRRVILRTGLIARDTADIPLSKVDLVFLEQGILDRIFGAGNVVIRTVGETSTVFARISAPAAARNAVIGAMENRTNGTPPGDSKSG